MSQSTTRPPIFGAMQFEEPARDEPRLMPVVQGNAADQATAQIITAQRVAIKRNLPDVTREARHLATAAGNKFYYSIPFKERATEDKPERVVHVEGPSIDCAMAALSVYGNCSVEALPARETATHWTFLARFVDYEKGVTVTRAFNQRKSQSTGMKDRARAEDIIFQIGQSKAIRNVVVGGLKWLTEEMFDAAKSGVLARIARNPEAARNWLVDQFSNRQVDLLRVERIIGRPAERWLATDMARLFAELSSVADGFADADDLWPSDEAEALRRADEEKAGRQDNQPAQTKPPQQPERPEQPDPDQQARDQQARDAAAALRAQREVKPDVKPVASKRPTKAASAAKAPANDTQPPGNDNPLNDNPKPEPKPEPGVSADQESEEEPPFEGGAAPPPAEDEPEVEFS